MLLNKISWSDFLTVLLVLTALYYLTVVPLFYRNEIRNFLQNRPSKM